MMPSREWNEATLLHMLGEQEEETVHLDYKERRALVETNRNERSQNISKDVSSFLNSDGGTLVFGIREDRSSAVTGGAPISVSALDATSDGFSRDDITKETLENVITSSIQSRPRPEHFRVTEVTLTSAVNRIVLIVDVAKSIQGAFQAKDRKYYKRFNFKSEPMDHWEIQDVNNRAVGPNIHPVFAFDARWNDCGSIADWIVELRKTG